MSESQHNLKVIKQLLRRGQFRDAIEQTQSLSKGTELLYLRAVCFRYLGECDNAHNALRSLHSENSDFASGWQELGHLHIQEHQWQDAINAFQTAVKLNPALKASWQGIKDGLTGLHRTTHLQWIDQQIAFLEALSTPQYVALNAIFEGNLDFAQTIIYKVHQKEPDNAVSLTLLAKLNREKQQPILAESLLLTATVNAPKNEFAWQELVDLWHKRQKFPRALEAANTLTALSPHNPVYQNILARELMACCQYEQAKSIWQNLLEQNPYNAATFLALGHLYKAGGDTKRAVEHYSKAIELNHYFADAWWSLFNLKTSKYDQVNGISLEAGTDNREIFSTGKFLKDEKIQMYFVQARAMELRGRDDAAVSLYKQANHYKNKIVNYSPAFNKLQTELQIKLSNRNRVVKTKAVNTHLTTPIFVVGLPRSGSTLVEQILASHSQVDGTFELPNIIALSQELSTENQHYLDVIAECSVQQLSDLGQKYLDETQYYRQNAPFFVDKMPNNFKHIALIKTILPQAKVIDIRRHPYSCCFSIYKELFAQGQEFSYDINNLEEYYRQYRQLMAHWHNLYPNQILEVRYENLVTATEQEIKRLFDYCGLKFEEQCLSFHKTKRAVRTASAEQVRQPIYQHSIKPQQAFVDQFPQFIKSMRDEVNAYENSLQAPNGWI